MVMKKQQVIAKTYYPFILGLILLLSGCTQMSELESDPTAGSNGGFEISRNGAPVNWSLYTPKTVPNAIFEIVLDTVVFKEGERSLKFDVKECSSNGGWHSPGLMNEFFEVGKYKGEATYKLSFWIKNSGSKFSISAGGVAPNKGEMITLIENDEQIDEWRHLEFNIDVPEDRWLRMQVNILEPGIFWIDDVRIEQI